MNSSTYSTATTIPYLNTIRDALDMFDDIYRLMEERGHCDAFGGMEYTRKRGEWIAGGASVKVITHYVAG